LSVFSSLLNDIIHNGSGKKKEEDHAFFHVCLPLSRAYPAETDCRMEIKKPSPVVIRITTGLLARLRG
jgi:hypothetical protein